MTTTVQQQQRTPFVPWIFYQTLVQRRRTLLYWMAAMGGLTFYTASFYPTLVEGNQQALNDLVNQLPPYMEALFGQMAGFTSPEGYLDAKLYLLFMPFVLMVYTIRFGLSIIAGEEQAKTIDILLANPISRTRVVLEKYAAMLVATALIVASVAAGVWLAATLYTFDIDTRGLIAISLHLYALIITLGTLAMFIANATANTWGAAGITALVAVVSYFINSFATLSETAERLRPLSLFYYYRGHEPLFSGVHVGDLLVFTTLTIVFLVLGVIAVNRRDLGT